MRGSTPHPWPSSARSPTSWPTAGRAPSTTTPSRARLAGAERERALRTLEETTTALWPGFRYRNFDAARLAPHFAEHFALRGEDLGHFVDRSLRARSD